MASDATRTVGAYAAMLDALLEGFQVIGFDYRYLVVNAAAARHGRTSVDRLIGRTIMACYPGVESTPIFEHLKRCLEERSASVLENQFRYPDGGQGVFELRFEPVPQGACILSIDISRRKEAETSLRVSTLRLQEAERMEVLGKLAAGMAHEFNNLLGVMLGYGEASLARESGPRPADIEGMMAAAQRAAELTQQLLAYGRKTQLRRELVDPLELVRGLESALRRIIPADIELRVRAKDAPGKLEVDPVQLEKVITHLVTNARDALPGGGNITIELAEVMFDEYKVEQHPGCRVGPHVMIAVSDNGIGMDAELQSHIFQPFFTTKQRGRGSGLGLSTVYGIVKQSGGSIWVYSEPGCGTSFKIYLPRVSSSRSAPPPAPGPAHALSPGEHTVLVAEDDALLRTLAEHTLAGAGYKVRSARTGDQALAMCTEDPSIAMLVTDVVMPGMRGPELIRKVRELRPTLKVLCTSGYAMSALEDQDAALEGVAYLDKPYLPSALVRCVRQLFES